jgi:hypothetical protein
VFGRGEEVDAAFARLARKLNGAHNHLMRAIDRQLELAGETTGAARGASA